jgi:membrane-associated phospholipid phosphatase
MAAVLKTDTERSFWPVDKVILAYFAFALVAVAGWWGNLAYAPLFLAFHLCGAALLIFEIRYPNWTSRVFRHWYPLLYVATCYKEMAYLIPAIRGGDADAFLAKLDYSVWGAHPTVWLERIQSPALTEFLQIIYTLFVPMVLVPAFVLWKNRNYAGFRYFAFLIALGYLVSYVGYLIVPARGPRFQLADLQHAPLRGLWLFQGMQSTLDRLESAHYDCFPSGHTELTILAWWSTRQFGKQLVFWLYFAYTLCIIFATVYLRYHYTVDVLAGVLVAIILIGTAPLIYRSLKQTV